MVAVGTANCPREGFLHKSILKLYVSFRILDFFPLLANVKNKHLLIKEKIQNPKGNI